MAIEDGRSRDHAQGHATVGGTGDVARKLLLSTTNHTNSDPTGPQESAACLKQPFLASLGSNISRQHVHAKTVLAHVVLVLPFIGELRFFPQYNGFLIIDSVNITPQPLPGSLIRLTRLMPMPLMDRFAWFPFCSQGLAHLVLSELVFPFY